jgi:adenosylcobinamide-phosphate synthase
LLKTTFAWRALHRAAGGVWQPLAADDLDAAREKLSWLVSRDASLLDEPLIAAAAIESLAENASDSVVAPLLYYLLFGLSGAFAYRAVNTLDAMIGYHGRYEHLGKVPARLDDLLNLVPARLTALLIVAAALPGGADARQAWRVMWQDSRRTASPNAGWPMAAMAGALGVRLEKVGHYCLNASGRAPTAGDLRRAGRVVLLALALGVGVIVIIEGGYHAYQSSLSNRH